MQVFTTVTTATIDRQISADDFFHVIDIWWRKPYVVNNRVRGAVDVKPVTDAFLEDRQRILFSSVKATSEAVLRRLIPKSTSVFKSSLELLCFDKTKRRAFFFPQHECRTKNVNVSFPYCLHLEQTGESGNLLNLSAVEPNCCDCSKSRLWLAEQFLPKITKWLQNHSSGSALTFTLKTVDFEAYCEIYEILKRKYASRLVKEWPEKTDPQKYVYEDLAIAAYLLAYWSREGVTFSKNSQFLDLGCGNGLLVYLLCQEKELAFEPSNFELPTNVKWLIGNHSDELSPWIPVLAARHPSCNFFLLPCCTYDFFGKFQSGGQRCSSYRKYVDYLSSVAEKCGFAVRQDVLRIPSTKRICLIGKRNDLLAMEQVSTNIETMLLHSKKIKQNGHQEAISSVMGSFVVREKQESRNCTLLSKNVVYSILRKVVPRLLESENWQNLQLYGNEVRWNLGGSRSLGELSKLLTDSERNELRHQHGGLQTFFRNQHQLFIVRDGIVQLRNWSDEGRKTKGTRSKTGPCLFYNFHSNGCPLEDALCTYVHENVPPA